MATLRWSGPGFASEIIPLDRFRIPDGTPNKQLAWVGYDVLGNMTSKGGLWVGSYGAQSASCPAGALTKPHAVVGTGASTWQSICYDQNGNMVSGGGRTITWNSNNLSSQVDSGKIVETYGYDADGARMVTVSGSVTTMDLGGVWQEQLGTGLSNNPYTLTYSANGQAIAVRNGSFNLGGGTVTYLHSDHLGSASAVSNAAGAIINTATYDPWGQVVDGGVPQTDKGYTGQMRDDTGLMWYQSRLYDPNLGRFLSADSVVPGTASGGMDGVALKPLTVDFHETGFVSGLNGENNAPFWFQMSGQDKQKAGRPWGPANPQSLNRYSYVLNNPLRYVDPTGHLAHVLQAWKEWADEAHAAVEAWAADMNNKLDTFISSLERDIAIGYDIFTGAYRDKMISDLKSMGWRQSDIDMFLAAFDWAVYLGDGAIMDTIELLKLFAKASIWAVAKHDHAIIDKIYRAAFLYENSHKSTGGVLSSPKGWKCDLLKCERE